MSFITLKKERRNARGPNYLLAGLVFFFAFFAYLSIYTMNSLNRSEETLKEKAERVAGLIISSNTDSMMDYNIPALKSSISSFLNDSDIKHVIIKDGTGKVLVDELRQKRSTREETVTVPFLIKKMKIGTLKITVTNSSRWKKTDRTIDLISSSSIDHLWDYNVSALKSNAESFFRDQDILKLSITEESGIELVRLEKEAMDSAEKLVLKKELFKDKRFIGKLTVSFCDCNRRKEAATRKQAMAVYILLTAVLGIGIVLVLSVFWKKLRSSEVEFHDDEGLEGKQKLSVWAISDSTEEKMEKAIQYIKENFIESISREGLASMLELNPDNLGRYFKIYTGEKINDYINRLRIEAAAKLLKGTEDSIVEIAYAVGFENISTFNRAFQKLHNQTPTEYRKNYTS